MKKLELTRIETWAAHPAAAPLTEIIDADRYRAAGNGTRTCSGGWQFLFTGVEPGQCLSIQVDAETANLGSLRDATFCRAYWGNVKADDARGGRMLLKEFLVPRETGACSARFSRVVRVPAGADSLTIRCTLRWTAGGRIDWHVPRIEPVAVPPHPPREVHVAVVTGRFGGRPKVNAVQDNVEFYADMCRRVCREEAVDLIALPEIALNWGVGNALETALPAPGPETDVFAEIAARHRLRIAIGMYERNGDACHNSIILVGPDRTIEARYRKVHLAWGGENESGLLPGDSFPVVDTDIGRIGFNICMDSSAAESARLVGLNGADFLVLAIMGDLRADRLSPGAPIFNSDRWLAIHRTRALDNQLCMVIARNNAIGSCIINRRGDVLAWNEGDLDWVTATVDPRDDCRYWNGGELRDVNWAQRRPQLYGEYLATDNYGSLG